MTDQPAPYPPAKPLERLFIHDGLMINTERWRLAHNYHRQRQNIHYQALFQPGIVYGLGVKVIPSPQNSLLRYRAMDEQQGDHRWLEIQAGLAIDVEGNPIIVDGNTDRTYRIAIDPPPVGTQTIYVVVSYVDPDTLDYQPTKLTVPERFRFDQKTSPPTAREIELCRIDLQPGGLFLRMPENAFAPQVNEINLLHRVQAQSRSHAHTQLGILAPADENTRENCHYLIQALPALYPSFQGSLYPSAPTLHSQYINLSHPAIPTCDLLFVDSRAMLNLESDTAIEPLRRFIRTGGVVLIETPAADSALEQRTSTLVQQLLSPGETEASEINTVSWPWSHLNPPAPLPPDHALRTQPFVFTHPPDLDGQPIQIRVDAGVIWVKGNLSAAWGIRGNHPRSDIRTAQELGINILYHAWQRRHLAQLMQW